MASNNLEVERYVDAKQNGKHLVDGNEFTYKRSRPRAETVYYVCTHKTRIGCNATAVVKGDKIVKKYGQHNHDTNLVQKRVREEEDKAIKAASTNHTSPRSVLGDLTASVCNESSGINHTLHMYMYTYTALQIFTSLGEGGN